MSIVDVDSLGTTIENTDTRIWFWCREVVFVTHRFDFMKVNFGLRLLSFVHIYWWTMDPCRFSRNVRLISSLAYASVAKLGYDPTMELFWKRHKWKNQIIVKGIDSHQQVVTKFYKTADTVADMSTYMVGQRMSSFTKDVRFRVFQAVWEWSFEQRPYCKSTSI